jgi:hypothetical protein
MSRLTPTRVERAYFSPFSGLVVMSPGPLAPGGTGWPVGNSDTFPGAITTSGRLLDCRAAPRFDTGQQTSPADRSAGLLLDFDFGLVSANELREDLDGQE